MSYFLAQVFDKKALIGRIVKNLDENVKDSLIKIKEIFILRYFFFFIEIDPKWKINIKGTLRLYIGRSRKISYYFI
jgi:hypothetical protein